MKILSFISDECIWLVNHHSTKSYASCMRSNKIVLHLQRVVCLCLNMNAELY